jgi:hypothetical protein
MIGSQYQCIVLCGGRLSSGVAHVVKGTYSQASDDSATAYSPRHKHLPAVGPVHRWYEHPLLVFGNAQLKSRSRLQGSPKCTEPILRVPRPTTRASHVELYIRKGLAQTLRLLDKPLWGLTSAISVRLPPRF